MRLRGLVVLALAVSALAVPTAAAAKLRLLSVTSPARPGSYATLTVSVSPARSCSITVYYKSGASRAQGLYSKQPTAGKVSWTWMVGTRTTSGRWAIVVNCGTAGMLQTSFVVQR
jgi:hypothetical protein